MALADLARRWRFGDGSPFYASPHRFRSGSSPFVFRLCAVELCGKGEATPRDFFLRDENGNGNGNGNGDDGGDVDGCGNGNNSSGVGNDGESGGEMKEAPSASALPPSPPPLAPPPPPAAADRSSRSSKSRWRFSAKNVMAVVAASASRGSAADCNDNDSDDDGGDDDGGDRCRERGGRGADGVASAAPALLTTWALAGVTEVAADGVDEALALLRKVRNRLLAAQTVAVVSGR